MTACPTAMNTPPALTRDQAGCQAIVAPDGAWRIQVTLLEASASLTSDIYLAEPIEQRLIRNSLKHVGQAATTGVLSGETVTFFIRVNGEPMGLGVYDHYSDSAFARVTRQDAYDYTVGFEDLPVDRADWDYNDVVLLVQFLPEVPAEGVSRNALDEFQATVKASPAANTSVALPLDGFAAVQVPAGAVSGNAGLVLTAGLDKNYSDLPGVGTIVLGKFYKVMLTNGQTTLPDGQAATITIAYDDADGDGFVDGTALLESELAVFHFNTESGAWEELPSEVDPGSQTVTAQTHDFSLFALGGKMSGQLDGQSGTNISLNSGLFGCWVGNAASPAASGNAVLMLLLTLAPAAAYRLRQARRA
jgi:hypothetical protein